MSNDGKYENGSVGKGQSDGGSHYLKIPLLLGFTCVLVGMTIFVAIVGSDFNKFLQFRLTKKKN